MIFTYWEKEVKGQITDCFVVPPRKDTLICGSLVGSTLIEGFTDTDNE